MKNIISYLVIIFTFSCVNLYTTKEKTLIYKSISPDSRTVFNTTKEFWEENFRDKTFIIQDIFPHHYTQIKDSVLKMNYKGIVKADLFYEDIIYALVRYDKIGNDTIYFDGFNKWWLVNKNNLNFYVDDDYSFTDLLKRNNSIFSNCE